MQITASKLPSFPAPSQTSLTQNHCLKFPDLLCIHMIITCAKNVGVNEDQCAFKEPGFISISIHHLQL